jgi:hypothetical protein
VAQCLATAGAELNAKDSLGMTALMGAAHNGHVETAQFLVYSGKPWYSSILPQPNYDAAIAELDQCFRRVVLTGIRDNIASLKDILLAGGADALGVAPYPERINLLKARICGVVFPAGFTQNLSGIPLSKFNHIVSLMRAAKIANLMHGVNSYFFTRIFMLKISTSSVLAKSPSTALRVQRNLLGFMLGKAEASILMRELQAIRASDMMPAAGSAASGGASEPEHSAAAHPCEKSL